MTSETHATRATRLPFTLVNKVTNQTYFSMQSNWLNDWTGMVSNTASVLNHTRTNILAKWASMYSQ